jgi:hypothetical protein
MKPFHKKNLTGSEPINMQISSFPVIIIFCEKGTYNLDFVGLWSAKVPNGSDADDGRP